MKALVFGTTGQVARELALQVPEGVTAVFLSRAEADFADPEAVAATVAAECPDVILNAVAYTAVDRAEAEEELALAVNGATPSAIARAAAAGGIPFLHVSTDYVFDGGGTDPWQPDDPTGPLGAYGRTKLAGEDGIRAAGGPHAILRTSWVFSAHGANFVKTMLRLAETRDRLTVVADQIGGPTPASSIADALWRMAVAFHSGEGKTGTFHFSGRPDVSWADFAREIFRQAGKAVEVVDIPSSDYPTPAKRPGNSRMDCGTLTEEYGISRPDWTAGLADVLTSLRAGM